MSEGFNVSEETVAYVNSADVPLPADPIFEGTVDAFITSINDYKSPESGEVVIFVNSAIEAPLKEVAVVEGQAQRTFPKGHRIQERFTWIPASSADETKREITQRQKKDFGVALGVIRPGELFSLDKLSSLIGKKVTLKLSTRVDKNGVTRQVVRFKKAANQTPAP